MVNGTQATRANSGISQDGVRKSDEELTASQGQDGSGRHV
jgi:hypothetical protein